LKGDTDNKYIQRYKDISKVEELAMKELQRSQYYTICK